MRTLKKSSEKEWMKTLKEWMSKNKTKEENERRKLRRRDK